MKHKNYKTTTPLDNTKRKLNHIHYTNTNPKTYTSYIDHLQYNPPTKGIIIQPLTYKRQNLTHTSTQSQVASLHSPQGRLLPDTLEDIRSKTEKHFNLQAADLNAWLSVMVEDPTSVADFVNTQCQNLIEPYIYEKLMVDKTTFSRGEMLKHQDVNNFIILKCPK